jgi:hypothetical protein
MCTVAELPLRILIYSVANNFKLDDSELLSNISAIIVVFISATSRPIRGADPIRHQWESQEPMLQLPFSHFSHIFD